MRERAVESWVEVSGATSPCPEKERGPRVSQARSELGREQQRAGREAGCRGVVRGVHGQLPQSVWQLSGVVPVPQRSVNWQTPSPQAYTSSGFSLVVMGRYSRPFSVQRV